MMYLDSGHSNVLHLCKDPEAVSEVKYYSGPVLE